MIKGGGEKIRVKKRVEGGGKSCEGRISKGRAEKRGRREGERGKEGGEGRRGWGGGRKKL